MQKLAWIISIVLLAQDPSFDCTVKPKACPGKSSESIPNLRQHLKHDKPIVFYYLEGKYAADVGGWDFPGTGAKAGSTNGMGRILLLPSEQRHMGLHSLLSTTVFKPVTQSQAVKLRNIPTSPPLGGGGQQCSILEQQTDSGKLQIGLFPRGIVTIVSPSGKYEIWRCDPSLEDAVYMLVPPKN